VLVGVVVVAEIQTWQQAGMAALEVVVVVHTHHRLEKLMEVALYSAVVAVGLKLLEQLEVVRPFTLVVVGVHRAVLQLPEQAARLLF
jgi:hypothetical protein